jgi:hydroxymethylbilane synthase
VKTLRIGTRGSKLALWQASTVARLIHESGGPVCELVIVRTAGDESPAVLGAPEVPGVQVLGVPSVKASFVKEIEDALLDGRVDLAVHSSKDLSAIFPDGLIIGATLARADARDAVLLPHGEKIDSVEAMRARLGATPRIGTSSVRRAAQLSSLLAGALFATIRGNVDTRLRKLDAGECDAGVLACAGLIRLGLSDRISLALPLDICIPAPGQGIVTIQVRADQPDVQRVVAAIDDRDARDALTAERAIVRARGGGGQMPLGAHAHIDDDKLTVTAIVIAPDGSRTVREQSTGPRANAEAIGSSLAEQLLKAGAAEILAAP